MSAEGTSSGSRRLVWSGLFSVALGVPLAVLQEAAGPYDDPKVWALPILVALTGLAWLVSGRGGFGRATLLRDARSRVVRWIVLACASWWVITTITSIAALQSISGTFGRGMGLLTMGSAGLLFFLIQSECRRLREVRSLVDVVLVGSVPVCLWALGQAVGWDPLPKAWDPAVASLTVRSTFGSHIFLGSYLAMLIPLTAARLEWASRPRLETGHWPAPTGTQWRRTLAGTGWVSGAVSLIGLASHWSVMWWALVPWAIAGATAWAFHTRRVDGTADTALTASLVAGLLATQGLVVVLSRGRGAFIATLVGLSVTVFAVLIRRQAWKTLTAAALGLVILGVFLALLNLPGSPIASLANLPLLSRLSDIANVQHGSPGWFRLQLWRGILDGWSRQLRGEEVIPGLSPRARSLIGYGQETQLLVLDPLASPFLGVLTASTENRQARYVVDRAHNFLLDHLVTEGLVGAGLWVLLVGAVLAVGISRVRAGGPAGEVMIRLGALGAVLAHLADGLVGIATPMPFVLFWFAAALLTCEPFVGPLVPSNAPPRRGLPTRGWWALSLLVAAGLAGLVGLASTRWLLASVAFAAGTRHAIAGRMAPAYQDFRRSVALAPWLPLPAESAAYAALRLAGSEPDPSRRLDLLHEAEAILVRARGYAMNGSSSWALTAQVAFGEARAGERSRLAVSRDAFAAALRLRPGDPQLLAQSGWAWLESGDAGQARRLAEQALGRDPREWLAWAVLARSARDLGDLTGAEGAARKARALVPSGARRLLDAMLLP